MPDVTPITGELQTKIMAVVWRLGSGTVEQVRAGLPPRYRGAYNTIQTVLNRLSERGLLSRHKAGNAFEYRPRLSEATTSRARSRRPSPPRRWTLVRRRWHSSSAGSTRTRSRICSGWRVR